MKLLHSISTLLFVFLVSTLTAHAQIGIGTTTPDPNAALDVESTTQGVLIPRMLKAQRELIGGGSPAAGLLVYQTDDAAGFYFYNGTAWVSLTTVKPSGLETVDEGNGNGLVRVGRDPANYGNVGIDAVDLSFSNIASTTNGATGFRSTAMGYNTEASGANSTALGRDAVASGNFSLATGRATLASGVHSVAMGVGTLSSGDNSTALGRDNDASGAFSTALGQGNIAAGSSSTATGIFTEALGQYSTTMGSGTLASGQASLATGWNTQATGNHSTSMGFLTRNNIFANLAIGRYNDGFGTPTSWVSTDPVFEIGIGTDDFNRNNAMTVLKNGNVGIGVTAPSQALDVVGNAEINGTAIVTNNLQVDNTTLFVNASNNRVGIGTTGPSQVLDVVGNAEINGTAIVNGNANISNNVNAGGHIYGERTAFSAYQDATIFLSSASETFNLTFSDITDPYGSFNGLVFTAPRSGLYFFSTSVSFDNGNGDDDTMWMGFSVNNASPSSQIVINPRAFTSNGREQTYSHTMVLNLIAGQNVRVQLLSVSATTDVRVLERTFTGFYLGDL